MPTISGQNPLSYLGVTATDPPNRVPADRAPTTSDTSYPLGTIWVDRPGQDIYVLVGVSGGSATWEVVASGEEGIDTVNTDSGAATPAANAISILGGANISTSGAGSTVTVDLDATITGITSITGTTANFTTFDTNVAAAAVTLSGTTLAADGTDANINLTLTPKGTGIVDIGSSNVSGGTALFTTFDTNVAAAAVTLTAATLAADGTDANIDIVITPKGTGVVNVASNTVRADTFLTSSATLGTEFTDNSITATGSDANIPVYIIGKGTGSVGQTRSTAATDLAFININSDNTDPATAAHFETYVGGTTAGDPYYVAGISAGRVYSWGIDNSSANDNFVLSRNATLGTGNVLSFDGSSDAATFTGDVTAPNFITSSATLGVTYNANTITASGSNANIDITLVAKGSGDVQHSRSESGVDIGLACINSSNTASSAAHIEAQVGGTTASDAYFLADISGGRAYSFGVDNSTTNDDLVFSRNATLGTNNVLVFDGSSDQATFSEPVNLPYVLDTTTHYVPYSSPVCSTAADTGGAPTGATGATNLMIGDGGDIFEYFILGAGQTIIAPRINASGLLISLDQVDDEGAEWSQGITAFSKHSYVIGTDAAFFAEATFTVADASGVDPLIVGFRRAAAYDATLTNYTDYASIGISGSNNPGQIHTLTQLNSGGQTDTNTTETWVDGATHTIRVNVDGSGNVTYLYDGVAPATVVAFQFDAGDTVIPFFRLLHATVAPGNVFLTDYKCGPQ